MQQASFQAISDPQQIKALASSIRHELVDMIFALGGEASVSEISENCGLHADGIYYHLRILQRAKLIEPIGKANGRNRRFRLLGDGKVPLRIAYQTTTVSDRDLLLVYVHGLLEAAKSDFGNALNSEHEKQNQDESRRLWAARNKGWVNESDLSEINALLERLCALMSKSRSEQAAILLNLSFCMAPSEPKGRRRQGD
jgi:DNA-binding transcriptional ArsR family regulator